MKTALLFSGGWDSIACYFETLHLNPDLLFFFYNQNYQTNEVKSARQFADHFREPLREQFVDLVHDQERRNFFLIAEAKRLGYERVILGSRNVLPLFDRFKDSNYYSLKAFGRLMNVEVVLPITGWNKRKIVQRVRREYSARPYNCYANRLDFLDCPCPNCAEMRKIL